VDPEARVEIIGVLAELKDIAAEPLLVRLLADEDPMIRGAAVRALGAFATKSALRHVLAATRDPESTVRAALVDVLRRTEDRTTRTVLERLCMDPSPPVAEAARQCLDAIADA
jgi:HEAT repeat protein